MKNRTAIDNLNLERAEENRLHVSFVTRLDKENGTSTEVRVTTVVDRNDSLDVIIEQSLGNASECLQLAHPDNQERDI